jgi:NADH-quinone oxidoreductase subunit C
MNFSETVAYLRAQDAELVSDVVEDRGDPFVVVPAASVARVAELLRDGADTQLDQLSLVSGVDYPDRGEMEVVYHFDSIAKATPFTMKAIVSRDDARVPTLCGLYSTADWHEREVYDLSGVTFEGHPNLVRILCVDDWVGHPLRRDYVWPEEYHGIPCGPFAGDGVNIPPDWEIEDGDDFVFTTKKGAKA